MINYKVPEYYKYVILFKGKIEDIEPVLRISNMSELKSINKGRMHLFDELLIPILPAIDYCLHMPRTEFDTYDTDTEVLDKAYDVPHEIIIMPEIGLFPFHFMTTYRTIRFSVPYTATPAPTPSILRSARQ